MTTTCDHVWDVDGPCTVVCTECGHVAQHSEPMLPEISAQQIDQALAAWGDELGFNDAMDGNPEDPGKHCPGNTFADHYTFAYADTVRAMAEVDRMELPRTGTGDEAGGAQGTRPAGNTIRWRERILWASVGLAIGSWCTGIAVYVSTVSA